MQLAQLSADSFVRFARLVYDRAGIFIGEEKRSLLSNRLRARLKALSLTTFEEYYERFSDPEFVDEELPFFLSAVTTNETYFFRNERLWELFEQTLLQEIVAANQRSRSVRIWSAASSSGEEAYTVAILLRERLPDPDRWRVQVIGTDISRRVLDRAGKGIYNDYAVSKMSPERRKRWFDAIDGNYQLKDEARRLVRFQMHNLRDQFMPNFFDIVLLRNVLMYFDNPMKKLAIQNAGGAVAPGRYLYVGDVDPIRTSRELCECMPLTPLSPGLYRKAPAGGLTNGDA